MELPEQVVVWVFLGLCLFVSRIRLGVGFPDMREDAAMSLSALFDTVSDPRAANASHRLSDVILVMIAAVMCGRKTATDIALFAELRREALAPLLHNDTMPSHDTISRLLRVIDPSEFGAVLRRFSAAFGEATGCHVAIDGKALRRACDADARTTPPMMVSAWASEVGLTLAALPGAENGQTDEGRLAVEVVQLLDLTGKIVTADALHANRAMAEALTQGGCDYILRLKRNRAAWCDEAEALFARSDAEPVRQSSVEHGRKEWREATVIACAVPRASGHKAYGRIIAGRGDEPAVTRYYLLSKKFEPAALLTYARAHWNVETALHWTLDVHLAEDQNRGRRDHSPANIGLLNRFARNLLQLAETNKTPISHRITKCTFSDTYLTNALSHMQ